MMKGHLSQYFSGIAAKRLSAVEADTDRSNQHEFDGVATLKTILGSAIPKRHFNARFIYLDDENPEPVVAEGSLTWYDARENHPSRSECRLYFPTTAVSQMASAGDMLVLARKPDDSLLVIVADAHSTIERQLQWLFGIANLESPGFEVREEAEGDKVRLEFASRFILEEIGVIVDDSNQTFLDGILSRFGAKFPKTREFSAYARDTLNDVGAGDDPDRVILAWIEREEVLFRTLEKHLIADRLRVGFEEDVDAFISYSLSVQNRRKSRAGSALENHLEFLFCQRGVRYARTPRTENRSRPDFVFPGESQYHDVTFPCARLTMLGVKSSCKERWRQVLSEADRIPQKHLLTLEPGISEHQTDEMTAKQVSLVLPAAIHGTYSPAQQNWLLKIADFISLIAARQQM